jgi:hypothetical protein
MVYIAIGGAVTITCDSCGFKFHSQGNTDHRAAIRALGWEAFETDCCPTCIEAKHRLDEEAAFTIVGAQATENYLIWSDEHRAWRGSNVNGYTRAPASAGRFGCDAAIKTCRNRLPVDLVTLVAFPERRVPKRGRGSPRQVQNTGQDCGEVCCPNTAAYRYAGRDDPQWRQTRRDFCGSRAVQEVDRNEA